jgi:hypothetical protein
MRAARARVYIKQDRKENHQSGVKAISNGFPIDIHPVLEEQPKWKEVTELLKEIERIIYQERHDAQEASKCVD